MVVFIKLGERKWQAAGYPFQVRKGAMVPGYFIDAMSADESKPLYVTRDMELTGKASLHDYPTHKDWLDAIIFQTLEEAIGVAGLYIHNVFDPGKT